MCLRLILAAALSIAWLPPFVSAQEMIQQPARQTPVVAEADVVVIGGGLSGIGAALGAARTGAKTIIIERSGYPGGWMRGTGLGTPLAIRDWRPTLGEGVLRDIAQRTADLGAEGYPDLTTALEMGQINIANHEILPQAFQSLAREAGVKTFYFCTYTESIVSDRKIEAVIVQTPSGRGAVRGKIFIDCTGLATVAAESGAPVKHAEAFAGLACVMSGVNYERYADYVKSLPEEIDPEARQWLEAKVGYPITTYTADGSSGGMDYPWDDWLSFNANILGPQFREAVDDGDMPLFYRVGEKGIVALVEGLKVAKHEIAGDIAEPRTYVVGLDPTNAKELTEGHIKSTEYLFKLAQWVRVGVPGFENAQITRIAETTLNRAGRSIENDVEPTAQEINSDVQHDDAIAILQRGPSGGLYEVPYRAMLPEGLDNLLAVGKSSSGGIRFRTHNLTVIMGQAAGTAAAIAVQDGVSPKDVNIRKVQAELREDGVPIPAKP